MVMEHVSRMHEAEQKYFDAGRRSVRQAREFVATTLTAWNLAAASGTAESVQLCVSELASNALAYGTRPGHGFLVRLAFGDGCLRLEVHDSRDRVEGCGPRVCHPGEMDARGRGLLLVEAVADAWGVEDREPFGKVVWTRFKTGAARRS